MFTTLRRAVEICYGGSATQVLYCTKVLPNEAAASGRSGWVRLAAGGRESGRKGRRTNSSSL